jgi:hypothetical protein
MYEEVEEEDKEMEKKKSIVILVLGHIIRHRPLVQLMPTQHSFV